MPEIFDPDQTASYYDDASIATFYDACWGGEDIHIGRYDSGDETVAEASAAMTRHLLDRAGIGAGLRVLDIACGYGGTLRTLARRGCDVAGIDISNHCVSRARNANADAGLDDRIDVGIGDFHRIDASEGSWDAVVCQEAIIHSPDRPNVFAEVYRVLRPGGAFVFSDILTGNDADLERVGAAFARLGAQPGATVDDYVAMARDAGFDVTHVEERRHDIRTHYDKLAAALDDPIEGIDADAVERISASIARWRAALEAGDITWACFIARKPGERREPRG